MRVSITGTRDGMEWPQRGGEIDLPEREAKDLIDAGLAEAVTSFRKAAAPAAETAREALVPKRKVRNR